MQLHPAQNTTVQGAGLIGQRESFGRPELFSEKTPTKNTRRSRVTAPADLEPPEGLGFGFGLGLGLGSGRSGPTCKDKIEDTRPAQSFVQDAAAHTTGDHSK